MKMVDKGYVIYEISVGNKKALFFKNSVEIYNGSWEIYNLNHNEIIVDYFILNLDTLELTNPMDIKDDFVRVFKTAITENKNKIKVVRNGETTQLFDRTRNSSIMKVEAGQIVKFDAMDTIEIRDNFLMYDKFLQEFKGKKIKKIGDNFMKENNAIKLIGFPSLIELGKNALYKNKILIIIEMNKLETIGDNSFYNARLSQITLPNLKTLANSALPKVNTIYAPEIENITFTGNMSESNTNNIIKTLPDYYTDQQR